MKLQSVLLVLGTIFVGLTVLITLTTNLLTKDDKEIKSSNPSNHSKKSLNVLFLPVGRLRRQNYIQNKNYEFR